MIDIEIVKREDQADGNFNNGEILEKKPIGFPQDGGLSKPYSNIFYWAHAWTNDKKSTIGLHPHQGFEICSFILEGNINHYDTKQEKWIPLKKGDVQIIRAGKGISHAEELLENSEIFQIWFDPDLSKSLMNDASYDDYSLEDFKIDYNKNYTKKVIVGPGSNMQMDTDGIEIFEYLIPINNKIEIIQEDKFIYSYFLIEGKLKINDVTVKKGDFFKVIADEKIEYHTLKESKVFVIKSPVSTDYLTYSSRS